MKWTCRVSRFKDQKRRHKEVVTFIDHDGHAFYSINITVGVEDETCLTRPGIGLLSFNILNELNKQNEEGEKGDQNKKNAMNETDQEAN